MQQIIYIHGGTCFNSYKKFINNLKTKPVDKSRLTYSRMWFQSLDSTISSGVELLLPSMPNKQNASFKEWSIWFTRLEEAIQEDAIIIGHSLGAIFLAKYLSQNKLVNPARAILMLAGPYADESLEDLADFAIDGSNNLPYIFESASRVVFIHGVNDPAVSILEQEEYRKSIPMAEFHRLDAPDHFMRSEFPEMVNIIDRIIQQ